MPNLKMFTPYNFAMAIDKHFTTTEQGALESEDFYCVVETLQITGSEKNQKHTAELFMRLPKEEVIFRAKAVVRLTKLLNTIHSNKHDLQSPPTP